MYPRPSRHQAEKKKQELGLDFFRRAAEDYATGGVLHIAIVQAKFDLRMAVADRAIAIAFPIGRRPC
jgi:hypothetical protein